MITKIANRSMKYKIQFQGVSRVHDPEYLKDLFLQAPEIESFLIKTEKVDTPEQHIHFVVESNDAKLNVYRFRKKLKSNLDSDIKIKNGMLNFSKVKDWVQMITYLQKEGSPDYVHDIQTDILKFLKERSFEKKKISMTRAILKLKQSLSIGDLDPEEYTVQYRLTRNSYRKPDPHWQKEYERALEQTKDEEQIRYEVREFARHHGN